MGMGSLDLDRCLDRLRGACFLAAATRDRYDRESKRGRLLVRFNPRGRRTCLRLMKTHLQMLLPERKAFHMGDGAAALQLHYLHFALLVFHTKERKGLHSCVSHNICVSYSMLASHSLPLPGNLLKARNHQNSLHQHLSGPRRESFRSKSQRLKAPAKSAQAHEGEQELARQDLKRITMTDTW
eukprot:scaffold132599_cov15-Tisochrysis_lutea.AAC.1